MSNRGNTKPHAKEHTLNVTGTRWNWGRKTMNWSQFELHGSGLDHRERKRDKSITGRKPCLFQAVWGLEHPLEFFSLWKTEKTLGSGIPVRAPPAGFTTRTLRVTKEKRAGCGYPQLGLSTWLYTMGINLVYNPSFPHPRAYIQRQTEKWRDQYRGENFEYTPTDILP